MKKSHLDEVRNCYNLTAEEYSKSFLNELENKPFDRNILDRFAEMMPKRALVYDFGCGSGQTTKYLYAKKKFRIIGLDFAEKSVVQAKKNFPGLKFEVDDMLKSKKASSSAGGIVAFYSVVHFNYRQVKTCFNEWFRLLKKDGCCLFCFHVGDETLKVKNFLEVKGANATWRFLDTDKIISIAEKSGFKIVEAVVRYPYKGYEHESKRAYVMMRRK